MDRKPLIGVSILAVILLVLGSLSNVVGYQSVKSRGIPESIPKMQIGPGNVNWTVNGTMGENGWYISPITLTCIYDHEVIAHVYYKYEGSGYTEYTEPFTITNQGFVTLTYYAVDYEGEIEDVRILPFRIDYTPPYIDLNVEKTGFRKWLFSAITEDDISGVVNVEFYLDGKFLGNVTATPYEYVWTGSGNHSVFAIAYDAAGLNASRTMSTPYTVQSSNQQIIKEEINQSDLLFQTIVDIANNKEIQRIILKSQMSRGIFPTSEFPVVTKNQIRQMYFLGLLLSKVISKSRILSITEMYQLNNQKVQKEITAILERDNKLSEEITQLSNLNCQCESQSIKNQVHFPLICGILLILLCVPTFFILITATIGFPLVVIDKYVENPVVTLLMALCAIPIIIWSPVFIVISSIMFLLECFGPPYPPL